jgi:hypothetical protein
MPTLDSTHEMQSVVTVSNDTSKEPCGTGEFFHDVEVLVVSESSSESSVHDNIFFLPDSIILPSYTTISDNVDCSGTNTTTDDTHRSEDEALRLHIRETCEQLLVKLETIRLSVLHLQYSLHAGVVQSGAAETQGRSNKIWNWDNPKADATTTVKGLHFPNDVFSANITSELEVPGDIYDVYDFGSNADASNVDTGPITDDPTHTTESGL